MATELYAINKGANYTTVTKATGSATTAGMELTIDLTKFDTKESVLLALDNLKIFITRDVFAPA